MGNKMMLFCRTKFHLSIWNDGAVNGTKMEKDAHAHLELITVKPGIVRIKSIGSNLYLAMDLNGRLYGEFNPKSMYTLWFESIQVPYNTYQAREFSNLKNAERGYLAIKKNGLCKNGNKTNRKQKATQFLPRRSMFEKNT